MLPHMRKRLDRYIQDALQEFAEWYVNDSAWQAKERDCVNLFAHRYLARHISPDSAIQELEQIRIECAVKQPKRDEYKSRSVTKDLVIWDTPLKTTWDEEWNPAHEPRAIIEWKTSRKGNASDEFDQYDRAWLEAYTDENRGVVGFLVSTHATKKHRKCTWAIVRRGKCEKVYMKSKSCSA